MKDAKGNDLYEGWYWYTHANENDLFYPVYYKNGQCRVDHKWYAMENFKGLDFYRAEMPIVN